MKRRLVLLIAATCAFVGGTTAAVHAETSVDPSQNSGLYQGTSSWLDQLLGSVPAPPGWHQRHICAISDEADKSLCFFFPYPA